MKGNTLVPTRSFIDQDHARETVWYAASKATAEILYLLDASTGPGGHEAEGRPPSKEESSAYKAFRDWFGPQIASVIQSIAIGPVLSSIFFDPTRGNIKLDRGVALGTGKVCDNLVGNDRLASRAAWLINEIQSLQDFYGELYEAELSVAMESCSKAAEYDFSTRNQLEAVQILGDLEKWHMYAQPGARLMRGDPDAIKHAKVLVEEAIRFVEEMDKKRQDAESAIAGDTLSNADEAELASARVHECNAKLESMKSRIAGITKERDRLLQILESYDRTANG